MGGKSSGGSSGGSEASDTLQSESVVRVLDAVSEGPIFGFPNEDPLECIYLDDVPIHELDGSANFTVVDPGVAWNLGTQQQSPLYNFPDAVSEISNGYPLEIRHAEPHSFTITDSNVDRVQIRFSVPQLEQQNDNGDIVGTSVELLIEGKDSSSGSVFKTLPKGDQILENQKCTSEYEWSQDYLLSDIGPTAPWTFRITRVTEDSTSAKLANKTEIKSYTQIIDLKLAYPNTAIIALQADAKQFSGIPSRGYLLKGLIVQIPSNYDPDTRTYTGDWDGSFKPGWTDNPAWCYYDLLTNERYGLGRWVKPSMVDKWGLYAIGQYCDELVDDGFGGKEPRFACNLYIQSQEEAYRVINNMASIFRGMTYYAAGAVFTSQDRPTDPSFVFNPTNVINGEFHYQGTASRARHNVALVTWDNPANNYKQEVEYVEDHDDIVERGFIYETRITAFGCTSRGMAHRLGAWTIYTERFEDEIESHTCGLVGATVRPGDVYATMDPRRLKNLAGGRVKEVWGDQLLLDRDLSVDVDGATVVVTMPDGTVEERAVLALADGRHLQTMPFSEAPRPGAVWMLKTTSEEPELWRCINVSEETQTTFKVQGMRYYPGKYGYIEDGLPLGNNPTPNPTPTTAATPTNLVLSESYCSAATGTKVRLTASWDQMSGAVGYVVAWKAPNADWTSDAVVTGNSAQLQDVTPGAWQVRVASKDAKGHVSPSAMASLTVEGKQTPPDDVTGFTATPQDASIQFAWTGVSNADLNYYEIHKSSWTGALVASQIKGTSFVYQTADVLADYYIKAVDTSGNWSVNAVKATLSSDPWDDFLIPSEKAARKADRDRLTAEKPSLDTQADAAGVSRTAYDAAIAALEAYLGGLTGTGGWSSSTHDWTDYATIYYLGSGGGNSMAAAFQTAQLDRDALAGAIGIVPSNDDILTIAQKIALAQQWAAILQVQTSLDSIATSIGITTEKTAYDSAISAVPTFFYSHQTPKVWTDLTGPTALGSGGGATLRGLLVAIAAKAQALQNAISNQAITLANQAIAAAPKMISALVALPNANYPQNQLVYLIAPWTDTSGIIGTAGKVYQRGIYRADLTASVWSWSRDGITASMIVDQLIAGQISAGIIGAQELAAVIALASIIESTNYQTGSSGTGPVGFYLGPPKNVTLKDGSTLANCAFELGGNASIGGFQASVVAQGAVHDSLDVTSTTTWTCPDGMKLATITLCAAGGGGHTSGGGGGGGETVQAAIKPTPGTIYTIHIPTASAAETDGGDAWMLPQGQTWKGDWASGTSYSVNDVVAVGTTYYRCTAANSAQQPPNASYWAVCTDVCVVARGGKAADSSSNGGSGGNNLNSGSISSTTSSPVQPATVIPVSSVRTRSIRIPGAGGGAGTVTGYICSSGGTCAENVGGTGYAVTAQHTDAGAGGGASALGKGGNGSLAGANASSPAAGEYGGGGGGGKGAAGGAQGKAVLWW